MSKSVPLPSSPEQMPGQSSEKRSPPPISRSLSSVNFSPNGDLYETLDDDWLMSGDMGELSLFDFFDSLSVIPATLDKFNRRLKLQSLEVPFPLFYR
jgi:hypothetical protein